MRDERFYATISASPLGQAVGEKVSREIADTCLYLKKRKSSILFQEGDPGDGLYFIIDGVVKLTRFSQDGRESILHISESPAVIAQAAPFLDRFPATAIAITDCELLLLRKEDVFTLVQKHGSFAIYLFNAMSIWLKSLVMKIEQLTLNDATARLTRYLLSLIGRDREAAGTHRVTLPVKKGELAILLNINKSTLSRTLRKLQDEGLIDVEGRVFHLLNLDALRKNILPPLG